MPRTLFSSIAQSIEQMFGKQSTIESEANAKMDALDKALAIIEFDVKGNILSANQNFLQVMGYEAEEVVGKHHSMFVDPAFANSNEYREFWSKLNSGKSFTAEFKRLGKHGVLVWIQATYNPVFTEDGQLLKVVKFASDITQDKNKSLDTAGQISAINRSQAVIEFDVKGNILRANENFLSVMGYQESEIVGKHHSMFVDADTRKSSEYSHFWEGLARGKFQQSIYRRIAKGGKEVWINASYNPILDENGNAFKVVKFATDVTQQTKRNADFAGQIEAIGKSLAVIEFELDGTIRHANDNFLHTVGYTLDEIKGKHHSLFAPPEFKNTNEYREFWKALAAGKFQSGEFRRIGKGGKEIWIQASYNPIFDASGRPVKVVKYASDITEQKLKNADFEGQIEAIGKSQAVIEFNMDGTIRHANENFLNAMGYTLSDVKGRHHSIFVSNEYKNSREYKAFWDKLNRGEFEAAEFQRFAKGGREIWIQASYNPIVDANGRPFKVVKYASDITAKKQAVKEISASLLALSKGDLTNQIENKLEAEFEPVRLALNSTIGRLNELVIDINRTSQSVSTAAREIKLGTNDLSERTESQASSLEQTSASMQEMTSTVKQNAETSKSAVKQATQATQKAERGGAVVQDAVKAMADIEASSKQISDIISVINEIAFQTNLLALNAAVEAARAGEQGRGFAVVAGEVRNLAQRSAKASVEIKNLINASVNKVNDGTQLVRESGENLIEIVEAIKAVSGMIDSMSDATQEQSQGIGEINKAIAQMDDMTQQNAGLAEETTAASENLFVEAENLEQLVSFFKTKAG